MRTNWMITNNLTYCSLVQLNTYVWRSHKCGHWLRYVWRKQQTGPEVNIAGFWAVTVALCSLVRYIGITVSKGAATYSLMVEE